MNNELTEKLNQLSTQIVSARASYAYNDDIATDPTMPTTRRQQARRAMRTVGRRIVRLVNERKRLVNEHEAFNEHSEAHRSD